nr:hypothetical protein [Tanacetum cinerariifolium]
DQGRDGRSVYGQGLPAVDRRQVYLMLITGKATLGGAGAGALWLLPAVPHPTGIDPGRRSDRILPYRYEAPGTEQRRGRRG